MAPPIPALFVIPDTRPSTPASERSPTVGHRERELQSPGPPDDFNPRTNAQERLCRIQNAYTAAVTGYPGDDKYAYALPARYSARTPGPDDTALQRTYGELARIKARLGGTERERDAAVHNLTAFAGRLTLAQRRHLARQVVSRPEQGGWRSSWGEVQVCAACQQSIEGSSDLASLPCGDVLHRPCIAAAIADEAVPRCPACKKDLTLCALLWDAVAAQRGSDGGGLWRSLDPAPVVKEAPAPAVPTSGPPSRARVKQKWLATIRTAYDVADPSRNSGNIRAWQLDADLRRLGYRVGPGMGVRDHGSAAADIRRALDAAGSAERRRRATAFLNVVLCKPASLHQPDMCCICQRPSDSGMIGYLPCGHDGHNQCWTAFFERSRTTQCPLCRRDVAVLACLFGLADEPDATIVAVELWLADKGE